MNLAICYGGDHNIILLSIVAGGSLLLRSISFKCGSDQDFGLAAISHSNDRADGYVLLFSPLV